MRWLLLKDLQILRRCPLQAFLLVAWPVLIAVLVGFAISGSPSKPRIAFLNDVPTDARVSVGTSQLPKIGVSDRICERVECVHVKSRAEAVEEVRSGDVLAALILPADLVDRINSLSTPSPATPKVEVIVNEEDPVKARLVNDRINSLLTQANLVIARRIATEGGKFLNLVLDGGQFTVIGQTIQILGLRNSARILEALRPALPAGPLRDSIDQVIQFTTLARNNLGTAGPLLTRLTQPIAVDKQVVNASTPPLEVFAIAVAATFTLAFVTVLLVAGSLALEREENAFPRLTRGLVSRSALLTEKVALGVAVGLVVTLLMLAGLALFVPLHWSRFGLWLAGDRRRRRGAWGRRGGAWGGGARGPRRLAARLHGDPAGRLPLADPLRHGRPGALRRDQAGHRSLPLQAGAAGDDRRRSTRAVRASRRRSLHLAILIVAYGLLARFALRRFTSV